MERNSRSLSSVERCLPLGECSPTSYHTEPMPQPIPQPGMRVVEQNELGGRFIVAASTEMPSTH